MYKIIFLPFENETNTRLRYQQTGIFLLFFEIFICR